MDAEGMKYSVLMSVYEKEKAEYLKASIESMLNQTLPPSDFVLVCDGPLTKELDKVIAEVTKENPELFQIIRLETCGGLGKALAVGIKKCRNDWIARMDSDDISAKERCEKQLELAHRQEAAIIGSNILEFALTIGDGTTVRRVPETDAEICSFAKRRNPFNHPSVMFRKTAVLESGNYKDCKGFEDYYLWVRLLKNGYKGYNIQQNLVYMRTDEGMYERRGSFAYARQAWRARWKIHKTGYSSLEDFFISAFGQLVVSLLPLGFRKKVYGKLLRKQGE